MIRRLILSSLFVTALLALALWGLRKTPRAADAQSTDQFAARIDRLVRDLDVPEESDRLTACAELLRIGPAAAPLLRARLGHPNPVIRRALLEILAELE